MLTLFRDNLKRKAFTLVEVLITVTIIGVVGGIVAHWFTMNSKYQKRITEISDAEDRIRKAIWVLHEDVKTARSILYPRTDNSNSPLISDTRVVIRNFDGDLFLYYFDTKSKQLKKITQYIPTTDAPSSKTEIIGTGIDKVIFTNRNEMNNLLGIYIESGEATILDSIYLMNE